MNDKENHQQDLRSTGKGSPPHNAENGFRTCKSLQGNKLEDASTPTVREQKRDGVNCDALKTNGFFRLLLNVTPVLKAS